MNDYDLSTAVRESVADIHSTTPVTQIISRGRAVRARRRIPGTAGALAVAAGAALAVTALVPSSHPGLPSSTHLISSRAGSHPASARLAAWTVARQPDGDIDITINQLQNPAGLQSTLRADGLPVNVTFSGPSLNAACQPIPAGSSDDPLTAVAQWHMNDDSAFLVIDPSALPSGVGVAIFDEPGAGLPSPSPGTPTYVGPGQPPVIKSPPSGITGPLAVGLVYASQQCTG
jgi:hypothetical protein